MFKKTIIATAIAVSSMSAMSATWDANFATTAAIHTDEGITGVVDATGIKVSSGGVVRAAAEYYVGDLVKFTYTVGVAGSNVFPTSFKSLIPGSGAALWQTVANCSSTTVCEIETIIGQNGTKDTIGAAVWKVGDQFTATGDTIVKTVTIVDGAGEITFTPATSTVILADVALSVKQPDVMDFGRQTSDASSVTYRVGAITTKGGSRVGAAIALPSGVMVKAADLVALDASVSYSASTAAGAAIDTLATAKVIGQSIPAVTLAITNFDGVVDVEKDRKALVGGTAGASADALTLNYTAGSAVAGTFVDSQTAQGNLVLPANNTGSAKNWASNTVVHTVDGDFAFMDNAATAGVTTNRVTDGSGTTTIAMATTGAKFTVTDTSTADTVITVTKDIAANVIPVQSFSGKSVYGYNNSAGTAKVKTVTHASLGAFTLNGAAVTAYAVPMGTTVSRFLWVSNKGAASAAINATVIAEGVSYGPYALGSAAALKATSVGGLIDSALLGAGVTLPNNSRATITIDSPVKQADITVSASYKHIGDSDRLILETSDTLEDTLSQAGGAVLVVNKK